MRVWVKKDRKRENEKTGKRDRKPMRAPRFSGCRGIYPTEFPKCQMFLNRVLVR